MMRKRPLEEKRQQKKSSVQNTMPTAKKSNVTCRTCSEDDESNACASEEVGETVGSDAMRKRPLQDNSKQKKITVQSTLPRARKGNVTCQSCSEEDESNACASEEVGETQSEAHCARRSAPLLSCGAQ